MGSAVMAEPVSAPVCESVFVLSRSRPSCLPGAARRIAHSPRATFDMVDNFGGRAGREIIGEEDYIGSA